MVILLVGEIGGFMGLLLGGSIISLVELIDFIIVNLALKLQRQQRTTKVFVISKD